MNVALNKKNRKYFYFLVIDILFYSFCNSK